jgi:succinylglutamate desuccinylase
MSLVHASLRTFRDQRREIGRVEGSEPGPTLVCVGSLHGNEPAGVSALERVFTVIDSLRPTVNGELVGLAGNVEALARRRRYVDTDLNRRWTEAHVAALVRRTDGPPVTIEDQELLDLLREMEWAFDRARGDIHILDLHTTSGASAPFVTIADTLRNRRWALRVPAPVVLGLEEQIDGTMLGYLESRGYITMGVEGGQHDDPTSVDHLEAVIWTAMAAAGVLAHPDAVPNVARARATLRQAARGIPNVLEVRHRHPVEPDDGFRMEPGYASFRPVRAGEPLAHLNGRSIVAPESGRILMPLYQTQGDDGFFIMREFSGTWLVVSAVLRRLRADALFRLLPGVRRDPDRPGTLVIDRGVARYFALEVFHLLGYRRRRIDGDTLVVSRRRER